MAMDYFLQFIKPKYEKKLKDQTKDLGDPAARNKVRTDLTEQAQEEASYKAGLVQLQEDSEYFGMSREQAVKLDSDQAEQMAKAESFKHGIFQDMNLETEAQKKAEAQRLNQMDARQLETLYAAQQKSQVARESMKEFYGEYKEQFAQDPGEQVDASVVGQSNLQVGVEQELEGEDLQQEKKELGQLITAEGEEEITAEAAGELAMRQELDNFEEDVSREELQQELIDKKGNEINTQKDVNQFTAKQIGQMREQGGQKVVEEAQKMADLRVEDKVTKMEEGIQRIAQESGIDSSEIQSVDDLKQRSDKIGVDSEKIDEEFVQKKGEEERYRQAAQKKLKGTDLTVEDLEADPGIGQAREAAVKKRLIEKGAATKEELQGMTLGDPGTGQTEDLIALKGEDDKQEYAVNRSEVDFEADELQELGTVTTETAEGAMKSKLQERLKGAGQRSREDIKDRGEQFRQREGVQQKGEELEAQRERRQTIQENREEIKEKAQEQGVRTISEQVGLAVDKDQSLEQQVKNVAAKTMALQSGVDKDQLQGRSSEEIMQAFRNNRERLAEQEGRETLTNEEIEQKFQQYQQKVSRVGAQFMEQRRQFLADTPRPSESTYQLAQSSAGFGTAFARGPDHRGQRATEFHDQNEDLSIFEQRARDLRESFTGEAESTEQMFTGRASAIGEEFEGRVSDLNRMFQEEPDRRPLQTPQQIQQRKQELGMEEASQEDVEALKQQVMALTEKLKGVES